MSSSLFLKITLERHCEYISKRHPSHNQGRTVSAPVPSARKPKHQGFTMSALVTSAINPSMQLDLCMALPRNVSLKPFMWMVDFDTSAKRGWAGKPIAQRRSRRVIRRRLLGTHINLLFRLSAGSLKRPLDR
jgi:hypothetical protein